MSVQYSAVLSIPPLYMVLYCLTPPEFDRYSSLNLCPPYPAWGENVRQHVRAMGRVWHPTRERNLPGKQALRGANAHASQMRRDMRHPIYRQLITDRWPLELMHCSN